MDPQEKKMIDFWKGLGFLMGFWKNPSQFGVLDQSESLIDFLRGHGPAEKKKDQKIDLAGIFWWVF